MWADLLLAGTWGGLLALERKAFLQAMLSRPLAAATVMGLLLDDRLSGLYVGMLLELFYLGAANLGAALSDHDTFAAAGTAAAAAALNRGSDAPSTPAIWAFCILLFLPLGRLGRWFDRRLERYSGRLARKAFASAERGELTRAVRQNLWGMWPHFLLFGLGTAVCAWVGFGLHLWWEGLPLGVLRALAWAYPAMAAVAAAVAVRGSHARKAGLFASVAASAVMLGGVFLRWGRP